MSIREVTTSELEAALATGAAVVDVRETDEYETGHVPGAVHVALGTVPEHIDAFRAESVVYVICRSGARSMRACEFLAEHGVETINVAGGTLDWIAGGRAVVTGSSPL
jgi:rhodanese-related sulfurtransferase